VIIEVSLSPDNIREVAEMGYRNQRECEIVVDILQELKMKGKTDIVVITPYIGQASIIKKRLWKKNLNIPWGFHSNLVEQGLRSPCSV
jgi:protein involved in sex pheromone biosynthesis